MRCHQRVSSLIATVGIAALLASLGCAASPPQGHDKPEAPKAERANPQDPTGSFLIRASRRPGMIYEPVALADGREVEKTRAIISVYGRSTSTQDLHDFRVMMGGSSNPTSTDVGKGLLDTTGLFWTVAMPRSGTQSFAMARGWRPMVRTVRGTAISNGTTVIVRVFLDSAGAEQHQFFLIEGGPLVVRSATTNSTQTLSDAFTFLTINANGIVSTPTDLDANQDEMNFVQQVLADPIAADL